MDTFSLSLGLDTVDRGLESHTLISGSSSVGKARQSERVGQRASVR